MKSFDLKSHHHQHYAVSAKDTDHSSPDPSLSTKNLQEGGKYHVVKQLCLGSHAACSSGMPNCIQFQIPENGWTVELIKGSRRTKGFVCIIARYGHERDEERRASVSSMAEDVLSINNTRYEDQRSDKGSMRAE